MLWGFLDRVRGRKQEPTPQTRANEIDAYFDSLLYQDMPMEDAPLGRAPTGRRARRSDPGGAGSGARRLATTAEDEMSVPPGGVPCDRLPFSR
jgi:hypothetical protein